MLVCKGKAEYGMTGTMTRVRRYTGPAHLSNFKYRLVDVTWGDGTPYGYVWIRESWLRLIWPASFKGAVRMLKEVECLDLRDIP